MMYFLSEHCGLVTLTFDSLTSELPQLTRDMGNIRSLFTARHCYNNEWPA